MISNIRRHIFARFSSIALAAGSLLFLTDTQIIFAARLSPSVSEGSRISKSVVLPRGAPSLGDSALLDELEARAAKYFIEKAFVQSGLVLDVSNNPNNSSLGATGLGLAVLPVIAARSGSTAGWIYSYEQARARAELILNNLLFIQQNQTTNEAAFGKAGFFYHFVNTSLERLNNQIEISPIDTAIVLAGALTAGNYFGGSIKTKAEQVFDNVDWNFFFESNFNQFYSSWKPETGFNGITFDRYSDEGLLVSLLALRRYPGNAGFEESLFDFPRYLGTYGSYTLVHSYYGSLFTYLLTHAFFDFKTLGYDRPFGVLSSVVPVDWWQNSIKAAKANRLFCLDRANTFSSFGADSWGLSATIRPGGLYFGDNGAMPADSGGGNAIYDGTMPSVAGISAMPLFQDEDGGILNQNPAFRIARHHYDTFASQLWGPYGFYASFNHLNQFSDVYLGIELGPLVLMIENYRSRLIWSTFMNDPETQAPLSEIFSFESAAPPSGNNLTRECEHWTTLSGGTLDFKPHASNGLCVGGGWGRFSSHYATYAVDLMASNNLVFTLRYASDYGGGWVDVYLDDQLRGSFFAAQTCPAPNACGWDMFAWSNSVQIGSVTPGTHIVKLATQGTPYGLNIDVFGLRDSTATPPTIENIFPADGSGFLQWSNAEITVDASDPDQDPISYQFLVNDILVQPWSGSASFDVTSYLQSSGIVRVKVQARDGFGGISEAVSEYAVFRHPIPPPSISSGGGGGGGGGGSGGGGCEPTETNGKEGGDLAQLSLGDCYPTA